MAAAAAAAEAMRSNVETVVYPYEHIEPKRLERTAPAFLVSLALAVLIGGAVHRMAARTVNELIDRYYEQKLARISNDYPSITLGAPELETVAGGPELATAMTN